MRATIILLIVAATLSIAGIVALGTVMLWPSQAIEEDDGRREAVTELFESIQVDSPDEPYPSFGSGSYSPEEGYQLPPGLTWTSLARESTSSKSRPGVKYAPSYLPEGFAGGDSVGGWLTYSSRELQLSILRHDRPGLLKAKRGYVEQVSVNDRPALIVRGVWERVVRDGIESPALWNPSGMLSILFETDNQWFYMTADGFGIDDVASSFDEAELIKVAESLQPQQRASR